MTHDCLHEEQIMGQSRAIERLDAELQYKKERLDELKADNKEMMKKMDTINDNLNDFISKSDTKDNELNNRLIKIETRQEEQEKATKNNREDFKLWLGIITVIFGALTIYFNYFH